MPSFHERAHELLGTLLNGYRENFQVEENWQLGDETIVAMANFVNVEEKSILGLKIGSGKMRPTEASEYTMFFIEEEFTDATMDRVEQLYQKAEDLLIEPRLGHAFTILTAVFLTRLPTDKALQKRISRLSIRKQYERGKHGWSMVRLALIDVDSAKTFTNKDGRDVSKVLQANLKK